MALAIVRSPDGLRWTTVVNPPQSALRPATERPNDRGGIGLGGGSSVVWQTWNEDAPSDSDEVTTAARTRDDAAWTSEDFAGSSGMGVRVDAGAGGAGQAVLIGYHRFNDSPVPTAWTTASAGGWHATSLETPWAPGGPRLTAIDRRDRGYVVVGLIDDGDAAIGATWRSADGVTWTELRSATLEAVQLNSLFVAVGPAGAMAAGEQLDGTVGVWLAGAGW